MQTQTNKYEYKGVINMGGTWTENKKIFPGAYINFLTNAPLSITVGDRGIVALLRR